MTDRSGVVQMRLKGNALTFIASVGEGKSQSVVGSVSNIRDALGQGNVNEGRLDVAIAQVEDLIMPILRSFPATEKLEVGGAELAGVFRLLSATSSEAVPIEAVERLFNHLADHAVGSPVAWRQSMSPSQVALGLVVLREVMHHGGYSSFSLLTQTE